MLKYSDIKLFPKVELHCHLDGSIRPKTLQKIAKMQDMPISDDLDSLKISMTAPKSCQNLVEYLSCFDFVLPYLQTSDALEMAAFDVMEQAANDGIKYIEIRFAPSLSMEKGLSVEETIEAVARGIYEAEKQYNIHGNILIIGMKNGDYETIQEVFSKTISKGHEKCVGFDLAGAEKDYFLSDYGDIVKELYTNQGIQLTLHAGECGCTQNIFEAINHGASRIGHGISLTGDSKSLDKLTHFDVCIEGCPTSNVQTKAISSYQAYPFREWLDKGINFCINTDNRTVSDTTLSKEYSILLDEHHMTADEFRKLNLNGINYSFATNTVKEIIREKILSYTFDD